MSFHTSLLVGLSRCHFHTGLPCRALFRRDFTLSRVTSRALGVTPTWVKAFVEEDFSSGLFLLAEKIP